MGLRSLACTGKGKNRSTSGLRNRIFYELQPFARNVVGDACKTGNIPLGLSEACNQAELNRISVNGCHDDWNYFSQLFGGADRSYSKSNDTVRSRTDQLS